MYSLSLLVHIFNALNLLPEGSNSNLWCPGCVLSFQDAACPIKTPGVIHVLQGRAPSPQPPLWYIWAEEQASFSCNPPSVFLLLKGPDWFQHTTPPTSGFQSCMVSHHRPRWAPPWQTQGWHCLGGCMFAVRPEEGLAHSPEGHRCWYMLW